jgi:Protein of unknown function (DUF4232)
VLGGPWGGRRPVNPGEISIMLKTRVFRSDAQRRTVAACALAAAALLSATACASQASTTSSAQGGTQSASAGTVTVPATTASSGGASKAPSSAASTAGVQQQSSAAALADPACGNTDLKITQGSGTESQPDQAGGLIFTNVGGHTCTLRGYPGASITVGKTVINAARALNGFRGDLPPLTSPPLVTLSPGASAYSVIEWKLGQKGESCYPDGTGTISITAPNTTHTVAVSSAAHVGTQGICSNLEINPVIATSFFG